ncbi:MAG: metallophosphoesterase [Prevotellaceae bacterium]|jgi:Icc-related predicted phosphoesterase|nr:metallophosphoesterase [Prevotellaceae bacterium]
MKFIFTADLHGNILQYEKVFMYAEKNDISTIIFGGDLTPKDEKSRTPFFQRMFLKESLFPLINKNKNILIIMGNDDFRSNESFLQDSQESVGFKLFNNQSVFLYGFYFAGYPFVPYTPFVWKDWEKRDLENHTGRNLRKETLKEGFISKGDDFKIKKIFLKI